MDSLHGRLEFDLPVEIFRLRATSRRWKFSHYRFQLPSTLYHDGNRLIATQFNDFGTTLSSNPIVPWYLSDSNCTTGSAQNENFTTTVSSGGGTTGLTLANSMPNSVSGVAVRQDNGPSISAAAAAASAAQGTLYIPAGQSFTTNSFVMLPHLLKIWQAGTLQFNEPLMIQDSTNWSGESGVGGGGPPSLPLTAPRP